MNIDQIAEIFADTMKVTLLVSGPLMAVAMLTGLLVSIFQAATQVNEQTLTVVPKIVLVLLVFVQIFPWMMRTLMDFSLRLLEHAALGGGP